MSKNPLTPAQHSLLAKGPIFVVTPKPPNIEYTSAIKAVSSNLTEQDVQELKADANGLLKRDQALRANLTREENKAPTQLKKDQGRGVLTPNKVVAMVVLNKEDYIEKAGSLLEQSAYRTKDRNPTNIIKAKHIQILRRLKRETGMGEGTYKAMYPTSCTPPKVYGLPKIHKTSTPSGPLYLAGIQSHIVGLKSF